MLGILLLAVSSKAAYYTVLSAAVLVGIGYVVAHLRADRKRRA
jgi:hypothetical protein